jgi:hypothetical protein
MKIKNLIDNAIQYNYLIAIIYFIIILSGCNPHYRTYYISSTGQDGATGITPEDAWKSIDKVNATTFKPGDKILFQGGVTFAGSLNFDITDSGTPENPVTVASFGAGRATIESGNKNGLHAKNTSGFIVKDLIFSGAGAGIDDTFSGINFYTDLDTIKPAYIRIDNVKISGYRWEGIRFYGEKKGSSGFRNVRITNAEVHDIGDKGISFGGPQPENDWGHKNIYVGHCKVYNIRGISGKKGHSGNGIILSSVDSAVIEYCTAYNNGEFSDDPNTGGPIGIWYWDTRNGIIQFCESFNNKTGNRADGGGFDLDGGCVNCVMQYNFSHGNDGAGYGIYQYTNAREFKNNVVRYNISVNDGLKNHHGGINLWSTNSSGGIRDTKIYNNTIIVTKSTRGSGIAEIPDEEGKSFIYNTEIYNNIFLSVPDKKLIDVPYPSDQWTFRSNCYWTYGADIEINWGGREYSALTDWRLATGQEKFNNEDVGLQIDPELVIPYQEITDDNPDEFIKLEAYKLNIASPLIDNGLDLKSKLKINVGLRDFYGTNIPQGSGYDVGAHEVN